MGEEKRRRRQEIHPRDEVSPRKIRFLCRSEHLRQQGRYFFLCAGKSGRSHNRRRHHLRHDEKSFRLYGAARFYNLILPTLTARSYLAVGICWRNSTCELSGAYPHTAQPSTALTRLSDERCQLCRKGISAN